MFAVFRERTPGTGVGSDNIAEFRRIRAEQPGYRGIVEVADDDRRDDADERGGHDLAQLGQRARRHER